MTEKSDCSTEPSIVFTLLIRQSTQLAQSVLHHNWHSLFCITIGTVCSASQLAQSVLHHNQSYNPLLHNNAFEILCFENIMENGAFALLEQMLHFP